MDSISGVFFNDQNGDGSIESSDGGLSGHTVNLLISAGLVIATTTTDSTGAYRFNLLPPGNYYLQFIAPTGDVFSPAGSSTTLPNSVVDATGRTSAITLGTNDMSGVDAGAYIPVSLSGTVFTDSNDDGLVDGSDSGLRGVTVQLLNAQGVATGATTVTAANGTYSFTNLAPGTYAVHVVMPSTPAGEVFSPLGSNTPPQPTGGALTAEPNLLVNGSFDNGLTATSYFSTAQGYAGWTLSASTTSTPYGSGPGHGPEIAWTNGANAVAVDPTGATNPYASAVAPDNADPTYAGGSGYHAAFFVDDGAIETLSQTVTLTAGQIYEVGFDLNETTPGAGNPGFFQLQASIGGQVITTAGSTSGTRLVPGTWTHFADLFTPSTTGSFTLTFTYASGLPGSTLASKDVLVDDVYIVPGQTTANLTTTSEVNAAGITAPVTLTSGQTVGNESAGIYAPPATISGTLFLDMNADGSQETGDIGVSGQTVNLGNNGTIVATAVTNASGGYSFTNQPAGTYTVLVAAPSGDSYSPAGTSTATGVANSTVNSGGAAIVTVANGGTASVNAGVYAPVTLAGTVFLDSNGDGAKQAAETVLAGQTISLIGANGTTVLATTTTNATGRYAFSEAPGTYTVKVAVPTGDGISPAGASTTLLDSTVGGTGSQTVTLTSGHSATINAGLYVDATISGTLFLDTNADGAQQSGEAGLGGQTVNLLSGSTVLATTTTTANGTYSFTGVTPGSDTVQIVPPPGDHVSPLGTSATLTDSTTGSVGTQPVTVTSGSSSLVNEGVYAQASVGGTVFTDANADGVKEATDSGVPGQTVMLLNGTTVIATTTTDAGGNYSFAGLMPGSYAVQTSAPAGDSFSPAGGSATLPDSTIPSSGMQPITLISGAAGTVNAGEYAPGTIHGTVFADTNGDGSEQGTESGLGGQTVNLLSGTTIIATTTTAPNGSYSFTAVTPGSDTVQVVAPTSDVFSPPGTSATLPESGVGATGTSAVTVTSGSSATVNAGVYAQAGISGTVFADVNADGVQDGGDAGVSGQSVILLQGTSVVASTTTDVNGAYGFPGLAPGDYMIQTAAPASDRFSPAGGSTTLSDSTVSAAGTQAITLTSGSTAFANAGEYAPGTIQGSVFADANADGVQQAGEAGLGGQTVELLSGGTIIATTTTGSGGAYSFTGVTPGADTVQFAAPAGDAFSTPGEDPVTVTSGSSSTVNAGVYAPAGISGTVFADANADGSQESGDAGLPGQTIDLLSGSTVLATTTSGANGAYSFPGLVPGSYTVQATLPADDSFSPSGTSTTLPNSTISASGAQTVTLVSGATGTANIGEYGPGSVHGTVFTDSNGDGARQSTEAGLGGVTVNLLSGTITLATTTTAADGSYSFTGVTPGNDTIAVVPPAGESFSPVGTSATLPDSTVSATGVAAVTVSSAAAATVNAGLYVSASISSRVFIDGQADGIYHVGDPGVPNVTVELLHADGGATGLTTTTDANGNYGFANIVPGTYETKFDLPGGTMAGQLGASADASLNNDADPATAITAPTVVLAGSISHAFNAGLVLTGTATGGGETTVPSGGGASFNTGGQVVVGDGGNNIHTNQGDNVILVGPGSNVVETSPGDDVVFSRGSTNAQALGATDFIFGGPGGGVLQGGSGSDYLVAGPGAYTLAGGAGPSTLVSGPGGGTVTTSDGLVTGYSVGDEIRPAGGATHILYQAGDGVDLLDTFTPGHDSLTVYGYAGIASTSVVNGHTVLSLGGNDAIVMNDAYDTAGGTYPGISFVPVIPTVPTLVEYANASGTPTLGAPGSAPAAPPAAQPAAQTNANTSTVTSGTTLTATNDATFTLNGGTGQNTLVGGSGADTILAHGTGNSITAGDGANTIVTGAGGDSVTAGSGGNTIFINGDGNTIKAGDGNNVVVLLGTGAGNRIALGNGANAVFAFGGTDETITAGNGGNTVFAEISASTVNVGGGQAFVFGDGNTVSVGSPTGSVISVTGANNATNAGNGALTVFQSGGSVSVGTGNHALYITGTGVVISAQAGDNVVIGPSGGATVSLGDGTQLVGLGGAGNAVTVGAGNSTIFAGSGNDTVATGAGNSTVVIAGAGNTVNLGAGANAVYGGAGNDMFTLAANAAAGRADIYNFHATSSGGDQLNLARVLNGLSSSNVTATASGADTLISVRLNGSSVTVADLHGTGGLSMAQLAADNALRFG